MISGHSGCDIKIENGRVFKTAKSADYNHRLFNQAIKQQHYYDITKKIPLITVPKIYNQYTDKLLTVEMEFIPHLDILEYLLYASKFEINVLIETIFSFIEFTLKHSSDEIINNEIIRNKYYECNSRCQTNYMIDIPFSIKVPIGTCHGDLTLSNLLVHQHSKQFVFIDFLDSFIESPLIDMVKIRQDTKLLWTLNIWGHRYNTSEFNKLQIVFKYLDVEFHKRFSHFSFYNQYYNMFEHLNLLRILPYCNSKTKPFITFLLDNINHA